MRVHGVSLLLLIGVVIREMPPRSIGILSREPTPRRRKTDAGRKSSLGQMRSFARVGLEQHLDAQSVGAPGGCSRPGNDRIREPGPVLQGIFWPDVRKIWVTPGNTPPGSSLAGMWQTGAVDILPLRAFVHGKEEWPHRRAGLPAGPRPRLKSK
jgi:hypothetical protein